MANWRLGFTGTHLGMTVQQEATLRKLLASKIVFEFHHGCCVGADAQAHGIAHDLHIKKVLHPPVNPAKRALCELDPGDVELPKKPYLDRDHDIVDNTDVLIAAPASTREDIRSGTWATVRYARRKGRVIMMIDPDGNLRRDGECQKLA